MRYSPYSKKKKGNDFLPGLKPGYPLNTLRMFSGRPACRHSLLILPCRPLLRFMHLPTTPKVSAEVTQKKVRKLMHDNIHAHSLEEGELLRSSSRDKHGLTHEFDYSSRIARRMTYHVSRPRPRGFI